MLFTMHLKTERRGHTIQTQKHAFGAYMGAAMVQPYAKGPSPSLKVVKVLQLHLAWATLPQV